MKNGGPAFPRTANDYKHGDSHKYVTAQVGMTMRDYFAAHALVVVSEILAGAATVDAHAITEKTIAKQAYAFADAMLAERERHS